ncbi:restriction endonuclease [Raoultella ornithinolytica]|uniref:restriction endonuclease n=1 Tax=Raoultella ornithinolytica TaxID=54291 RepID=UPI002273D282|nr:restriction endonuclease [Raoultella ornithinolytica]EKU0200094.1 restriction endonuclease [Raoultella ornithinolytica]EKU0200701.1 restriction endonuclease [Raoultella ornithinolytica]EKV4103472.1 restriction endonuclease [Raoultella ornithinolytica]EKV8288471.1 restriction endonuclease [Raoultella ornithinolytica]
MNYISKSEYLKSRMMRLGIVVLIILFILNSNNIGTSQLYLIVFGGVMFVAFLFLTSRWESTIGEFVRNTPKEDIGAFVDAIEKHLPVLARKRRILIHKDDYGYLVTDKWESEKKSYLRKLGYIPYETAFYSGITPEQQSVIIDSVIDDYLEDNQVDFSYHDSMTPYDYECYCADVLNSNGWDARTTPGSGDQGVDVIAEKNGLTVALQCKKYSNPVGNAAVQEVVSGKDYWGADIAVVITNSTYTPSARALAKVHNVHLLHHEQLTELDQII